MKMLSCPCTHQKDKYGEQRYSSTLFYLRPYIAVSSRIKVPVGLQTRKEPKVLNEQQIVSGRCEKVKISYACWGPASVFFVVLLLPQAKYRLRYFCVYKLNTKMVVEKQNFYTKHSLFGIAFSGRLMWRWKFVLGVYKGLYFLNRT
jgi:hypothetical protein